MDKKEIENLIKELIEKTIDNSTDLVIAHEGEGNVQKPSTMWFRIQMKDPSHFLNREGEALHALNYIARKLLEAKTYPNKENEQLLPSSRAHADILLDINGFHKKKIEDIEAMVHMMAERARYFKSSVQIDPMPAFERRIVHEFLSNATDLKTESEGVGPNRRVVIKYIGSL